MPNNKKTKKEKIRKPRKAMPVVEGERDYNDLYETFTKWYAMPNDDRWEMLGVTAADRANKDHKAYRRIPRLKDFAEFHNVHQNTMTHWKGSVDFANRVQIERLDHLKNMTPNVIEALYQKIVSTGDPGAVELWLAYVEGWSKKQVVETVERYDMGDIRAILSGLPVKEQEQFYDTITKAIQRAELFRRRGEVKATVSEIAG